MSDLFRLNGKTAVVKGGRRGIGKSIACGMAQAGADIVILDRDQEDMDMTIKAIKTDYGVDAVGFVADVLEESQITDIMNRAMSRLGRIDILVNNAGINIRKYPQEYTIQEWDSIIDINLRGAFVCSRAVYPHMKTAADGKIINIGSMNSIFAGAKLAPYAASKGGVVQLTKALAVAWGPNNIQVNAILPGWINTDLTIQARKDIEGLNERVIDRTPAGRWGETTDLSGIAVFLASNASNFLTGTAIPVDGGFSVMM